MSYKLRARARVQVTLDLLVPDTWDDKAPTSQIHSQARESALHALTRGVIIEHSGPQGGVRATVVGKPKVTMVLVDDEEGREAVVASLQEAR